MPPVPPVPRIITSWRREGPAVVVLRLECGHDRHVQHRPPLSSHTWATDDAATAARVGHPIECLRCGQRILPDDARAYRRTESFDERSVPPGLLGVHSTKAGTWGRLWVEQGELELWFQPPLSLAATGRPGAPIVIPPQVEHQVRLRGPVRFHVEFLRVEPSG
jgi:tellurite methyltransferase